MSRRLVGLHILVGVNDADLHSLPDSYSNAIGKLIAGLSLWDPEGVRDILT